MPCRDGDDISGLVYLKDMVRRARAGEGDQPLRTAVRPATFVPEQKRVAELLREMQTEHFHMAVVIDEYGATSGIVTMEDLLEEIVGEIADEYDVERPGVVRLDDGSLRVPGRMPVDDVSDELGMELPDAEWDTVGGLMLNLLGHVPEEGESVRFKELLHTAEDVQERRIGTVHIEVVPSDQVADAVERNGSTVDAPPA
jgi:CBS domain containing-hemolysin-like protein